MSIKDKPKSAKPWGTIIGRVLFNIEAFMEERGISPPCLEVTFNCDLLDKDHKRRKRIYAHAFHGGRNCICVHTDLAALRPEKIAGILVHEMGHVMSGVDGEFAEPTADEWIRRNLDIEIHYDLKDTLEYLEPKDMKKLKL